MGKTVPANITQLDIDKCEKIIKKYEKAVSKKKEQHRNELFENTNHIIKKWVKSFYSKHNNFIEEKEALSITWDCFLYALSKFSFDKKINIQQHFYTYTKFYILTDWQKQKRKVLTDNVDGIKHSNNLSENWELKFELTDLLIKFRNTLDQKYKKIFDDALTSMSSCKRNRTHNKDVGIPYYKYSEAKKCYRQIIYFLLNKF
jgi:hypothetical protein